MASFSNSTKIIVMAVLLLGFIVLGVGVGLVFLSLGCEHWPTTTGVITSAKMEASEGREHGPTFGANITYAYEVKGSGYFSGTRIAFGEMSASSAYAENILSRYPVGKKVTVFYSPTDPENAVLETGLHGGTWIGLGVGSAFVLMAGNGLRRFAETMIHRNRFLEASCSSARARLPAFCNGWNTRENGVRTFLAHFSSVWDCIF